MLTVFVGILDSWDRDRADALDELGQDVRTDVAPEMGLEREVSFAVEEQVLREPLPVFAKPLVQRVIGERSEEDSNLLEEVLCPPRMSNVSHANVRSFLTQFGHIPLCDLYLSLKKLFPLSLNLRPVSSASVRITYPGTSLLSPWESTRHELAVVELTRLLENATDVLIEFVIPFPKIPHCVSSLSHEEKPRGTHLSSGSLSASL
jgi:hypothetical protein